MPLAPPPGRSTPQAVRGTVPQSLFHSFIAKSRLYRYNCDRPHASLAKSTPINRLGLTMRNVLQLHM